MTFAFISGNLALDFVGTMGRWRTEQVDLLAEPADLTRWLAEAAVLDDAPRAEPDDLVAARQLRGAIYRLALAATGKAVPEAADRRVVNTAAAVPPVRLRLTEDGAASRSGDVDAALATLARSAIELVSGAERELIRECEAGECTRLYVDHSARRSRRWCDMRSCGNRVKAQNFRRRRASANT